MTDNARSAPPARTTAVAAAAAAGFVASVLVWAEVVHRRSERRLLGDPPAHPRLEAIVVLGWGNSGRRANYLNRYRVRAALRSIDPRARRSVLVVCGGAVHSEIPEAEVLAREARRRGFTGEIRLEPHSRTTIENIRNAIPLLEDADAIAIVSNSLHAEKARAVLWDERPDLARRLRRASENRFGEIALVKPFAAVLGLRAVAAYRHDTRG